jgi:hypothetical protein
MISKGCRVGQARFSERRPTMIAAEGPAQLPASTNPKRKRGKVRFSVGWRPRLNSAAPPERPGAEHRSFRSKCVRAQSARRDCGGSP